MALYHFSVRHVSRGKGQMVVASAAYISGQRIYDGYYNKIHDYTSKSGVVFTEILTPEYVPERMTDRETLWNEVEHVERNNKAQLAYSFDIALQNELTLEENIRLAKEFCQEQFVVCGMIVDLAVHEGKSDNEEEPDNPHFHVLAPIRPFTEEGIWGNKQRREYILDEDGNQCDKLTINADIAKVKESTPPDPLVSDTKPSWQKVYSQSSVQERISGYVSGDSVQELSWYTWSIGAGWSQSSDYDRRRVKIITGGMTDPSSQTPYWGAETENQDVTLYTWGVDNRYYPSATATRTIGSFYAGAVYISTSDIQLEKVTYSVSMSAEAVISPSDHCKTAAYSESSGKYTMKSGYGIQISVDAHLSGDTQYCTGSQTANVLFPEFNYNRHSTTLYNRLLEKSGGSFVFKKNKYSTYNDRVHFTPIWFPDRKNYTVYVEVFDVWCPAGQLSVRLTDQIFINGNVYDDWHIAPTKP